MTVSWQSTLILVASLAVLGVLAALKVPGAAVAAVAAPITALNWLTQGASSRKTGTSLFPPPMPPADGGDS